MFSVRLAAAGRSRRVKSKSPAAILRAFTFPGNFWALDVHRQDLDQFEPIVAEAIRPHTAGRPAVEQLRRCLVAASVMYPLETRRDAERSAARLRVVDAARELSEALLALVPHEYADMGQLLKDRAVQIPGAGPLQRFANELELVDAEVGRKAGQRDAEERHPRAAAVARITCAWYATHIGPPTTPRLPLKRGKAGYLIATMLGQMGIADVPPERIIRRAIEEVRAAAARTKRTAPPPRNVHPPR